MEGMYSASRRVWETQPIRCIDIHWCLKSIRDIDVQQTDTSYLDPGNSANCVRTSLVADEEDACAQYIHLYNKDENRRYYLKRIEEMQLYLSAAWHSYPFLS